MNGRNIQPHLMSLHNGEAIEMSHSIVSSNKMRGSNAVIMDNNKIINDQYTSAATHKTNGNTLSRKREADVTSNGHAFDENHKEHDQQRYDNNSMKFAFLAQQTTPDYRPQASVWD